MSRLFRFASALWLGLTALLAWFYLRVLNRVEVIGRENVPRGRRVLIVANHVSIIDSFVIGLAAFLPTALWRPDLFPWNPAAKEKFFARPLLRLLMRLWKCIPVRRHQHDFEALAEMERCLADGTMILYPEGTRSRSGRLNPGRPGVGKLIHDLRPIVVPVAHTGIEDVLPIGARFPRIGRRIRIAFGQPLELAAYYDLPPGKPTSQLIVARVMAEIAALRGALLEGQPAVISPASRPTWLGTRPRAALTATQVAAKEYENKASLGDERRAPQ